MDFQPLKLHNLSAHTLKLSGLTLQGFAPNDAVDVARNEESFKIEVGADGQVTRYDTHRRDGRVTFHLMSSSKVGTALAALILADELATNGVGVGALFLRDRNGAMVVEAEQAWIVKPADIAIKTAPTPRLWIVECANLRTFPGGQ